MNSRTFLAYGIAGVTAALIGVLLAWTLLQSEQGNVPDGGTVLALKAPRDIALNGVTDHNGNTFTAAELHGKWSLFFYGFTHCPDICPETLHLLQQAETQLNADGKTAPTVYMVTVDPERDSAENLKRYITSFNPNFIALRAEGENLKTLAKSMGAAYLRAPDGKSYTMQHTAAVFVVNPEGKLAGYANAPHSVESLVHAYREVSGL